MARLNPLFMVLTLLAASAQAQDGSASATATATETATGTGVGAGAGTTGSAAAGTLADDLTQPPQIDPDAAPGEAPLEPAAEEKKDMLEAVVTRGQTDWRLPDLGTSMRRDEDRLEPGQRIAVNWLPLFDPENQDPVEHLFKDYEDTRNVGTLKIFDIRFGERGEPTETPE